MSNLTPRLLSTIAKAYSISPKTTTTTNSSIPHYLHTTTILASTIQHFINSPSPQAQTIHAQILKTGTDPSTNISIKLIILHLKCGCIRHARRVFDEMPRPTTSAYNYLIAGSFKSGFPNAALGLVRQLAFSKARPDGFALSMALKLSAVLALPNVVKEVHANVVKLGFEFDEVLFAALIDGYVKNGWLHYARHAFGMLPERNVVCSTALITGYMNEGLFKDAEDIFEGMAEKDAVVFNAMIEGYSKKQETAGDSLEVYKTMQRLCFRPTLSTFVSVLGACSLLSAVEFGEQVHCQIIKNNLFCNIKSESALVDMYSKCGSVEDGRRIFDRMAERNVISWTSMIDGYGKNGFPHEALQLFDGMQRQWDVTPNYATFLSVLSTCGHAGLVSRGQEIFQSMEREYSLKPRMEHYACMVDLLGRFGSLHEAYDFVKGIPKRPNSDVWAALLGAATLHGDVDMANVAAKEVFELSRSGRPGAYMAFSNTLASAGKWEGVHKVRELMKRRGVSKDAACSWIGIDNALSGSQTVEMTTEEIGFV